MEIYIKLLSGKTIPLKVDELDKLEEIRKMIKDKQGIFFFFQLLPLFFFFFFKFLSNM
jgi:hypothetical protein